MRNWIKRATVVCALASGGGAWAQDSVADFYKSRTLVMQVGSQVGGIYDLVGRLVARHIGKYLPGAPQVVVQNVPGGGSLALANQFANVTPRDGSVIGVFSSGMATTPLFDPRAAKFDPRLFEYLGSSSREAHVLAVWRGAPVKTLDDIFTKELIVGASAPGSSFNDFPLLTNALLGTKFRVVKGYPGSPEMLLAMQRGELQGFAGASWASYRTEYQDVVKRGDLSIVAAFGMTKARDLEQYPLFPTGKSEDERQMFELMYARQVYGRVFAAPPGTPAERVNALRAAFEASLKDPALRSEAERINVDIDPAGGEELATLTRRLHAFPTRVIDRARELMGTN
jgi:tripartite-type tricarboxylate transporter receptor subunit TctC